MSITVDAVQLPDGWIALSDFGPRFRTTILENSEGIVDAQENWPFALWSGTIRYLRSEFETVADLRLDKVYRFFLHRHGMGHGFLVEDPTDNTAADIGGVGVIKQIDGVWRLVKQYIDSDDIYERIITRPGDDVVLSAGTLGALGVVTGIASPGTWTGSFLIPMRFTTDKMARDIQPDGTVALDLGIAEIREDSPEDGDP